jgi:2-polyprenyl-3-methyl-5-hydroxy-6-metoxy-1,4-benzoquinol methylase
MKLQQVMGQPVRVLRYLFTERSYERYYSAETWEQKFRQGYDLDTTAEDGRYGALLAIMQRYDQGDGVLDAGCGDGLLAARYRPLSRSPLVGLDYSSCAIDKARARGLAGCEFHCTDYRDFRTNEGFSVIVFNEALYYVEDFLGVMHALQPLLRDGGVFIVSMFDTRVTARIWTTLHGHFETVQGVRVHDEGSGLSWRICVLRPLPIRRARLTPG